MPQKYEREIQKLEKKIRIFHWFFIIGVIISIIGISGMIAVFLHLDQIDIKLDEGGHDLDEIDRELEETRFLTYVSGPLMMFGSMIAITFFNWKRRFLKLKQSYIDESNTITELSFIVDPKDE
jgi:hypothetical protein